MILDFLERISKPFVDRRNNEREEVLAALIKRAGDLGRLLFEQPTAWEFEWKDSPGQDSKQRLSGVSSQGRQSFVVFPAVVDCGSEDGTVAKPARQLIAVDRVYI